MYFYVKIGAFLVFLSLIITKKCLSQPLVSTKYHIGNLTLFPDLRDSSQIYYAPLPIKLKQDEEGRPEFQFLAMRYEGAKCMQDRNEISYINLAQLTFVRPLTPREELEAARNHLHSEMGHPVYLRPLPIAKIHGDLISAFRDEFGEQKRQRLGSLNSGENGDWVEKTFTLKLDNIDAQILIKQLEENLLAMSFGLWLLYRGGLARRL